MNREFLMLAHKYLPKHRVGGWFMSEKLDGRRMYWDGGITRGMPKNLIPWANTAKDSRLLKEQISTGLWSRYGNVIHAPSWWLDKLPRIPLDGEAYNPDMPRQDIMSITAQHEGDGRWYEIGFYCFDMPAYESVFADGRINNPNFKKVFHNIMGWIQERGLLVEGALDYRPKPDTRFESTYFLLKKHLEGNKYAIAHKQVQLPFTTDSAIKMLEDEAERVTARGGEGLVVRSAGSVWTPKRVRSVLKVKPLDDAEGIVVGYTTGRIGKEGKHLGRMGALIIEFTNHDLNLKNIVEGPQIIRMELSGFKDSERSLSASMNDKPTAFEWATNHPGEKCPEWITNPKFPRGSVVTFKYRGLSKDGVPQEARYWRPRNDT